MGRPRELTCSRTSVAALYPWLKRGSPLSQIYYPALGAPLLALAARSAPPLVVFSALHRLGLLAPLVYSPYWLLGGISEVLGGAAWVVVGLLDHWQLVRSMAPRLDPAGAVAR
jgi:hypothetical protein